MIRTPQILLCGAISLAAGSLVGCRGIGGIGPVQLTFDPTGQAQFVVATPPLQFGLQPRAPAAPNLDVLADTEPLEDIQPAEETESLDELVDETDPDALPPTIPLTIQKQLRTAFPLRGKAAGKAPDTTTMQIAPPSKTRTRPQIKPTRQSREPAKLHPSKKTKKPAKKRTRGSPKKRRK